MEAALHEYLASTVVGSIGFVLGLIIAWLAESRGDRAMAASWSLSSVAAIFGPHVVDHAQAGSLSLLDRLVALDVALVFVTSPVYIVHLSRAARMPDRTRRVIVILNAAGSVIGVAGLALGAVKAEAFFGSFVQAVGGPGDLTGDFWIFGVPTAVSCTAIGIAWLLLSLQELDAGERSRAQLYGVAVIPLTLSLIVALPGSIICFAAAVALSIAAVLRHLTVQGERAAFLSRFLSPQVAELVRLRGLDSVMKPQQVELSAVCIDFRGFTSYTEAIPSQAVIDLISDYHEAVAAAVARHDGMIKDYAGDGILILVGAPLPRPDHAAVAVSLAQEALAAAQKVTDRWATGPHPLGVGIGVASGRVTVGAIGDAARMDYTAVGTAVNLAARLCSVAEDGAVLLDEATASATSLSTTPRGELELKGLSGALPVYALS